MIWAKQLAKWVSSRVFGHPPHSDGVYFNPIPEIAGKTVTGHMGVVGHKHGFDLLLVQPGDQRRVGGLCHRTTGMASLPVGPIQRIQPGRVDQQLVKHEPLAGEAVKLGRFDPGVAIGAQVAAMQPIEDQANGVSSHGTILAIEGGRDKRSPTEFRNAVH